MAQKYARRRLERFLDMFPNYPTEILLTCLYDLPEGWYDTRRCAEMTLRVQYPDTERNPEARSVIEARKIGRGLLIDKIPRPNGHLQVNTGYQKLLRLRNGRVINITRAVRNGNEVRERDIPSLGCALGETVSKDTQWLGDHHSNVMISAKTGKQIVL